MERPSDQHAFLKALADVLVRERTIRAISQHDLETATGLSEQYIRRIEAGRGNPSYLALASIATALSLDLATLIALATKGLEPLKRFHEE